MTVERFPLMSINYDVTKRGNLGKRASSDWLKVMSFMLKAKITRINANLEIPLLGGLINFWRHSVFVLITLLLRLTEAEQLSCSKWLSARPR